MRKFRYAILPFFMGIVSAITGVLTNVASTQLPKEIAPYLWLSWPLSGVFVMIGIFLTIVQTKADNAASLSQMVSGDKNITIAGDNNTIQWIDRIETLPIFEEKKQALRNQGSMLNLVENTWIKGVLHKSLYKEVLIELGLQTQPDAIENPWETQVQWPNREPELLPPGKKIIKVFKEADCTLLILGEPGSGKTTTLLQLAEQAIQRARNNEDEPIPVVFNLSSWTPNQTLSEWLVGELNQKYYLPKKISSQWVERDKLMLLLDGLDEVKTEYRSQCLAAINTYLNDRDVSIAVCCRKQEYDDLAQQQKLDKMRGAILIQPLSIQQIDKYLHKMGKGLANVYQVLNKNKDMHGFFETPLALSILALSIQNASEQDIASLPLAVDQRKRLFEIYVKQMMGHRGKDARYDADQTNHWLSNLAFLLRRSGQSLFFIENLYQSWISSPNQADQLGKLIRLLVGMISGLVFGWIYGLINVLRPDGFFWGLPSVTSSLIIGLIMGLVVGFVVVQDFLHENDKFMGPIDTIYFQWPMRARNIGLMVGFGLMTGVIAGLLVKERFGSNCGINAALIVGLASMMAYPQINGLRGSGIGKWNKPEQGIYNSLKGALNSFIYIGLISGPIFGVIAVLVDGLPGLMMGLILGLVLGLMIGLENGGAFAIAHYVLRLTLYRANLIPWNLVTFLDYCTSCVFLRKVGGGYAFIHRMLMEYFAEMCVEQSEVH